jgi:phosphatidylserine decarboxylase
MKFKINSWLTLSIHKAGMNLCGILFGLFLISLFATGLHTMTLLILIVLSISVYFFRNPDRVLPQIENAIIAPADGKIVKIENVALPIELGMNGDLYQKVSIFLNVDNVHVQRVPVDAVVEKVHYVNGAFINASFDKASNDNERNIVLFRSKHNNDYICCVQIAGFVARRIVCDISLQDDCKKGDIYGIIKFGSRVDIYVPTSYKLNVLEGQTMVGGESIIAVF